MLWCLLVASSLFAAIGNLGKAATLLVAILPLIGMDVYRHRRTQVSTQGLRSRLAERATVIRNGAAQDLPATAVGCGDLVEVAAGG